MTGARNDRVGSFAAHAVRIDKDEARRAGTVNRCGPRRRLENTGWTDEARAASLAVRRANAAARSGQRPAPQVGGIEYAGGDPNFDETGSGSRRPANSASSTVKVSAINTGSNGKTYVGFTDNSVEPPKHYYLPVGGEDGGWSVKAVDGRNDVAVLVSPDGEETEVVV